MQYATPTDTQDREADSKKAKLKEFMELTNQKEVISALLQEFLMLSPKDGEDIPARFWKKFMEEVDTGQIEESWRQIYGLHYNEEEIDEILKFVKSPAGKKVRAERKLLHSLIWGGKLWAQKLAVRARTQMQEQGFVPKLPAFTDEEIDAIRSLRTLTRAQAIFREGDKDKDGVLAFAPNLSQLKLSRLIDEEVAEGAKGAYTFTLVGGRYDWRCVAMPAGVTSDLHSFIICADGEVRFAPKGRIPGCKSEVIPGRPDWMDRKGRR
ncbi:MAG: DUF2059 domain-containing protein [Planctomycetota bacterium]|nr:DUF2059 domain-containing protein [Planctomycetota bacterium]